MVCFPTHRHETLPQDLPLSSCVLRHFSSAHSYFPLENFVPISNLSHPGRQKALYNTNALFKWKIKGQTLQRLIFLCRYSSSTSYTWLLNSDEWWGWLSDIVNPRETAREIWGMGDRVCLRDSLDAVAKTRISALGGKWTSVLQSFSP